MKLNEVLAGTGAEAAGKSPAIELTGIQHDSRKVKAGDLFVALPGTKVDGTQFVGEALSRGAVAVLSEKRVEAKVPVYVAPNVRRALAIAAGNFFGNPAKEMVLLGVTGTNGKTTTTHLIESICNSGKAATGLIGTIEARYGGKRIPVEHTTPDPLELHRLLKEMAEDKTDVVVMEISSHALTQERVHGLSFRSAAFTNLTRDHLDYHKDLEDYFQAKRKLFTENLSSGGLAVVNGDDTNAVRIYNEVRQAKKMAWKFSRLGNGELSAANVEYSLTGIKGTLKTPAGDIPLKSRLLGPHNLENILAAVGVALAAGFSRRDVQEGIERAGRVAGRLDRVEGNGITALVDYAHTDDALRRAIESVKTFAKGRVLVVFGCGGDRDKGKRPLMGEAAAELADLAIVTSDNPRTEDPDAIIEQIIPGVEKAGLRRISAGKVKSTGEKGYLVDADRKAAIQLAVSLAKADDVILIAGKGHETYQQIGTEKHPFDDRQVVEEALGVAQR